MADLARSGGQRALCRDRIGAVETGLGGTAEAAAPPSPVYRVPSSRESGLSAVFLDPTGQTLVSINAKRCVRGVDAYSIGREHAGCERRSRSVTMRSFREGAETPAHRGVRW